MSIEPSIIEYSSQSNEKRSSVEIADDQESITALLDMVKNTRLLCSKSKASNSHHRDFMRSQSLFLDRFHEVNSKSARNKNISCVSHLAETEKSEIIYTSKCKRRCSSLTDIHLIHKIPNSSPAIDKISCNRLQREDEQGCKDLNQDTRDCDEDCSCRLCSCSSCCEDSKCDITNSSMDLHEFSNDDGVTNMKIFHSKHQMTLNECR